MSEVRAQLNVVENLAVGAFGGMVETAIQMPILSYKFALQEGRELPKTIPGWYRGVAVQCLSVAPITALQVMINGVLEQIVTGGVRNTTKVEQIVNSCVAGAISSIIYCPADLTMIHQQKLGMSPISTVSHLMKSYGSLSIYRGFFATAFREAFYTCGYLGLAPVFAQIIRERSPETNEVSAFFYGSLVGGVVAAIMTHPADTAKTCIQADIDGAMYKNARIAASQYYTNYGFQSLYRGFTPRCTRAIGAAFIVSSVREKAIQYKTNQQKN